MAEGHSAVRWARALQALVDEPLESVQLPPRWAERAADLPGQRVTEVSTHGKHLLVHMSGGLTLHCHAMMFGSWQFGRPGMEPRKPEKNVRLRLRTRSHEAIFFNGPVVELLTGEELRSHERLSALGPDLLHEALDREEAWRRLSAQPSRPLGDAILDQRIVAGVGNIFKSEGLFVARLDPLALVGSVPRERIDQLWDLLTPMMRENARGSGPIVTLHASLRRRGERYWVYRRTARPCFRCESPIAMIRQGDLKRTTYYCATCQARARRS